MSGDDPNLDLVNINAYNFFIWFYQFVLKILSVNEILNEILTSVKGHNFITYVQIMMYNNHNLNFVFINWFTKFCKLFLFFSQDIRRKLDYDGQNDGQMEWRNKIMMNGMTDRWNANWWTT